MYIEHCLGANEQNLRKKGVFLVMFTILERIGWKKIKKQAFKNIFESRYEYDTQPGIQVPPPSPRLESHMSVCRSIIVYSVNFLQKFFRRKSWLVAFNWKILTHRNI